MTLFCWRGVCNLLPKIDLSAVVLCSGRFLALIGQMRIVSVHHVLQASCKKFSGSGSPKASSRATMVFYHQLHSALFCRNLCWILHPHQQHQFPTFHFQLVNHLLKYYHYSVCLFNEGCLYTCTYSVKDISCSLPVFHKKFIWIYRHYTLMYLQSRQFFLSDIEFTLLHSFMRHAVVVAAACITDRII